MIPEPSRPSGPSGRQVWRSTHTGSLAGLRRESDTLAGPGPGEVRVAVQAVGLNFADVFAVLGLYSATPDGPFVPGLEFAGLVEAVGGAVQGFAPGQAVFGLTRFGAYATAVNADARYLRPLPPGWTPAEGAAFPAQALTAWYAIVQLGALQPGGAVLLHSAAGGVGLNALEILRTLDACVIATVGRESKRDFLVSRCGLPASHVIVREAGSKRFGRQLDDALRAAGAPGFDLVVDAVAGPYFDPAYARLKPAGRLVIYGAADMMPAGTRPNWLRLGWQYLRRPRVDPLAMISSNRSVLGFNLIWLWDDWTRIAPAYAALGQFVPRPPLVGHRYRFEDAPQAMRHLQSGDTIGKVVLEVAE